MAVQGMPAVWMLPEWKEGGKGEGGEGEIGSTSLVVRFIIYSFPLECLHQFFLGLIGLIQLAQIIWMYF